MAEIKLVTQNDEPALALGEYLLSEDGETLYVGSAGVESGSSEVIYKGQLPIKITSYLFTRIPPKRGEITINAPIINNINYNISDLTTYIENIKTVKSPYVSLNLMEV